MEQRDFFISYTGADEPWAVWIAGVLKRNGYTAYAQFSDINPGDNFLEKMEEFVENSANFIAVWSKAYSESSYCMTEFRAAFHEWQENRMKCLLPVRVDGHPMRRLYSPLVRVDLSDMSAASEKKLADAVRYAVPRPVAPTAITQDIPPQEVAEALYLCGLNYQYGLNDYAKALEYYEQAAAKGHVGALNTLGYLYNELGYLYNEGLVVVRDYAKAREYYKQAAAKGNVDALYNLGLLYELGQGVNVDYAKALEYYQKAADAGHTDAPAKLAELRKKLRGK